MRRNHVILIVFLSFIGLAMLAGLAAILLPKRYVSDEVMGTIVMVGLYSLGGLGIIPLGRTMKWTARVTSVGFLISLVLFLTGLWFDRVLRGDAEDLVYKVGFTALVIGFVGAHRLMIVPLDSRTFWGHIFKRSALIGGAITGLIIVAAIISEGFWRWDQIFVRLLGVSAMLGTGASIAAGAISLFGPKPGEDEPGLLSSSIPIMMQCPRCEHNIEARSNQLCRCAHCRLRVRIEVEEPRCACGYLLYQLGSDTCPECGKEIPADERWRAEGAG